jgi:hypothetical protein
MNNIIAYATAKGNVIVRRVSPFSRRENAMEIPMTPQEFRAAYNAWVGGELIQNAFSTLDAGQREFIKTGITPEEWDQMFGED